MKKPLIFALRLAVALVAVGYVVLTVNWTDHLLIHADSVLPDGTQVTEATVVTIQGDAFDDQGNLVTPVSVKLPADLAPEGESSVMTLPAPGPSLAYTAEPGIVTTLVGADVPLILLGLVLVTPIFPMQTFRWQVLLHARGFTTPWFKAFRLFMVGQFFNYCMPGTTGGDLVKAYYAAKRAESPADAVMTVVVDRVGGLMGLIILAGLTGLCMLDDPVARPITIKVWCGIGVLCLGAMVYFSRRLRRWLGLAWLLRRLPLGGLVEKVDAALFAFRGHKLAVANACFIGLVVHLLLTLATAAAGYALGITTSMGVLMVVVPVLFLAAAIPVAPQGVGIMEGLATSLITPSTASFNQIVGMLMLVRVYILAYSLLGALFLLKGDIHLHPEIEEPDATDAPPAEPRSTSTETA